MILWNETENFYYEVRYLFKSLKWVASCKWASVSDDMALNNLFTNDMRTCECEINCKVYM